MQWYVLHKFKLHDPLWLVACTMNFVQTVIQSGILCWQTFSILTIFEKSLIYLISRADDYLILNEEKSVKMHKYVEFQEAIYIEELEQIEEVRMWV